ncbi:hypothetical protein [Bradyrhizobium sp. ARR65]|uniref:hypothetical protein n=1 Tax=Bradyrhizobium sp. ARR65 TaxID=1040989 RepID=UPI0004671AF6|nr:hypothetical protein [Bradyrhizobium sp. ARR65]
MLEREKLLINPDVTGNRHSWSERAPLAHAPFGEDLPRKAQEQLHLPALSYHREKIAEKRPDALLALAPAHAAVLLALYRFYFYNGRLAEALEVATLCISRAVHKAGVSKDWPVASAGDSAFSIYEYPAALRLVLAQRVSLLVNAVGPLEEARAAIAKLMEIDRTVGAEVSLDVLARRGGTMKDDFCPQLPVLGRKAPPLGAITSNSDSDGSGELACRIPDNRQPAIIDDRHQAVWLEIARRCPGIGSSRSAMMRMGWSAVSRQSASLERAGLAEDEHRVVQEVASARLAICIDGPGESGA